MNIGDYRVERELGSGGMGTVFQAVDASGRRFAVKVMRASADSSESAQLASRFEREARAANEVRHPAIVEVLAFGKLDDGRAYLVMPYLEGCSLGQEIARRGKLPPAEAWAIAREASAALSSAHAASMIHRDLKPDNVFLERAGERPMRVRLLDFGIAKVHSRADLEKLTNTGVPLGTPSYMAPELWWGGEIDARVDQYALGITLFEAIAGHLPFSATGFMQLVQKHLNEAPPALGCTEEIDAFVAKLLEKKPEDRFPSMAEAIAAGDRAFGVAFDATVPALPPVPRPAEGRLANVVVAHVVAVSLALGLAFALGYAGIERWRPVEWYKCAGYPAHYALGAFLVALVILPARTKAVGWLALLPALFGIAGTWLDWEQVRRTLVTMSLPKRFAVMNEGFFETGTARFIGALLSLALVLSAMAIAPARRAAEAESRPGLAPREAIGALVGALVLAAIALFAHAPSGAFVAIVLAATLAIDRAFPAAKARDELLRAVASVVAVGLAVMIAFTRVEARELVLWRGAATRAERVAEVVAALAERRGTTGIALVCLLVAVGLAALRARRLWAQARLLRPTLATSALFAIALVAVGADAVLHARFEDARGKLLASLAGPFGLFARLDPPTADLDRVRFAPHRAPTLQITRDVVALDGTGVAKVAALDAPETAVSLAGTIGRAITQSANDPEPDDRDLALAIDRSVPWKTVVQLLGIAHRAGARRLELRFTRGPRPTLPASGPPEIGWVLPSDFVAVDVTLDAAGLVLPQGAAFLEVAPAILAAAPRGPVALSP